MRGFHPKSVLHCSDPFLNRSGYSVSGNRRLGRQTRKRRTPLGFRRETWPVDTWSFLQRLRRLRWQRQRQGFTNVLWGTVASRWGASGWKGTRPGRRRWGEWRRRVLTSTQCWLSVLYRPSFFRKDNNCNPSFSTLETPYSLKRWEFQIFSRATYRWPCF